MTAPQRFRRYARELFAASAMILATVTAEAAVCYVTPEGGTETKDGESWTTAYDEASFPAAIVSAGAGDAIWVKAGVYRPVIPADPASVTGAEQGKSFVLKDGVALYGGFAGNETSSADRDPAANLTVLTGDLDDNDEGKVNGVTVDAYQIRGSNSACVVTAGSGCGPTAVLDGFTVTAGNNAADGGGMDNNEGSPTVTNCAFSGNVAVYGGGGGLYNYEADDGGDGPQVKNCIFWGNSGGEIYNDDTHPVVTYCVIRSPDIAGKADSPAVTITADPLLGPLAWNGGATRTFALRPGSSAIDAGLPFTGKTGRVKGLVISDDQRGVSRDASPDIGAYEYWERKILTVHVDGAGSAAVDPAGSAVGPTDDCWSYVAGTSVTLTASPDAGSVFVAWSGDVSGSAATTTLTVSPDRYAQAIFATEWIIAASAGAGGAIAPSGNVPVADGANQTFTVAPNAGYAIANVLADGVPVGAVGTYTFTDVRANHTITASFGPEPTSVPTATPTPMPSVTPTPTTAPYPTPDPDIPLPTVTLKLTLLSGGTIVLGPVEITDPAAVASLLSSAALWAQMLETDPDAILSGRFNMDLVKFFSLLAKLDAGVTDLTLLLEVTIDGTPSGYGSQVFLLMRTFDSEGNPTGYSVVPQHEGETVFRKAAGAETWRISVHDGGNTDGDGKQDGSVAPQIAAVVAVFPLAATVTPTPGSTGSGGGCALPGATSGAFLAALLLAPVLIARKR